MEVVEGLEGPRQETDVTRPQRVSQGRSAQLDPLLAAASHELANPLLALVVSLEVAASKIRSGQVPQNWLLERLERMARTARHAQQIASCFLELGTPLHQRRMRSQQIDLRAFIEELVTDMRELLDGADCPVSIIGPAITCRVATVPLRQVLWNLISNATKYARGAPIEVAMDEHDDVVTVRISDRGAGLGLADDAVFEPFERGANADAAPGSGLGLYIVRELVTAMGGTVHWSPRMGGGTTFTVALPREDKLLL